MNQVIAIDENPYDSALGFSDTEYNYSLLAVGRYKRLSYDKDNMFLVFFHEVLHQFRINQCDSGDHCAETSIEYLPESDPAHTQDCVMHYPSTQEMLDADHKYPGMACLYSSNCPVLSEPFSLRNFDRFILKGE